MQRIRATNNPQILLTHLIPGYFYEFKIRAVNEFGYSVNASGALTLPAVGAVSDIQTGTIINIVVPIIVVIVVISVVSVILVICSAVIVKRKSKKNFNFDRGMELDFGATQRFNPISSDDNDIDLPMQHINTSENDYDNVIIGNRSAEENYEKLNKPDDEDEKQEITVI
jgi:hypothetical protein